MSRGKVFLAGKRGFCAGVRSAIGAFEKLKANGAGTVYILNELVHNTRVTAELASRGGVLVKSIDEVPEGETVLLGAHGVPPQVEQRARERRLDVVDATCPLVKKLQQAAAAIEPDRDLVIYGSKDHPETLGVIGRSGTKRIHIVSDAGAIGDLPDKLERPVLLCQTTRNHREVDDIAKLLQERHPDLGSHAEVCNAVFLRQTAVEELAGKCDLVLIVGSGHSSNARRLCEIASVSAKAFLIDGPSDIRPEWLDGTAVVGVGSGASTPEYAVTEVVSRLAELGFELED
ncbi:MAG: 4-hydroxy-3-methylbut-2-enyl diphosphate reductase [Victivallaceae bacterium]|nr:4-hydroxy-3-methylbut-2-enyl diphosphate reductase [Victivallaceae bacterium]